MDFHEAYTDTCSTVGMAARYGKLNTLRKLIDEGRPVDVKDNRAWTPLHETAYHGHTQCVEILLEQESVDINEKTFEGETALVLACQNSQSEVVEKLLEAGADKDLATNEDITPLFEACDHKSLDCVKLLLEAGCDINHQVYTGDTALHIAVERDCAEIMKLLLNYKADICACSHHNITPVFVAAQFGKADCLKLLLEEAKRQGKQHVVNITASDNASPLLIACHYGKDQCAELLLENGADAKLKVLLDCEEITMDALQYAVKFGHARCARLLLQHSRIDPHGYKHDELHPLRLAIDHKDISCLKMLVESGFRVDDTFYAGSVGFGSILCFSPTVEAAEYILKRGFNFSSWRPSPGQDKFAKELDPLFESLKNVKLTETFLKYGAKIWDNEAIFWDEIFRDKCFLRFSPYRLTLLYDPSDRLVANACFVYLLIKYGCSVNTCLNVFLNGLFYQCYEETSERGLFFLLYLLSVNVKAPSRFWMYLQHKEKEDCMTLMQKIEGQSHTLKHACRVAVARHMISLGTWDHKGVKRLSMLPKIILDYLQYKDYSFAGKHFMTLCLLLKAYLNGKSSEERTCREMQRLVTLPYSTPTNGSSDESQDEN